MCLSADLADFPTIPPEQVALELILFAVVLTCKKIFGILQPLATSGIFSALPCLFNLDGLVKSQ